MRDKPATGTTGFTSLRDGSAGGLVYDEATFCPCGSHSIVGERIGDDA